MKVKTDHRRAYIIYVGLGEKTNQALRAQPAKFKKIFLAIFEAHLTLTAQSSRNMLATENSLAFVNS